ncbi:MAG: YmdB family metallophosphoesterase [Treponema sp.]|jgi:calcineurin-like phosphoesterase|nr:YmdB family metallophosphoesterase [Treponema sp.]
MIGDVVGEPGLKALESLLPALITEHKIDFTAVNGENVAEGFGMSETVLNRILAAGADIVTSGNHIWEKREFWPVMEKENRILRPANYPAGCAGRGWAAIEKAGISWITVNLQGRELMTAIDCPFRTFDAVISGLTSSGHISHALYSPEGVPALPSETINLIILVDFHAESTEEKEALAFYLDGRASLVAGTHTHVQTADERILPKGTGYITDLGMTGPGDSVIGMDTKICLDRARTQIAYRMECAKTEAILQGIIAEIDSETGYTVSLSRISRPAV